eukprot:g2653.t1
MNRGASRRGSIFGGRSKGAPHRVGTFMKEEKPRSKILPLPNFSKSGKGTNFMSFLKGSTSGGSDVEDLMSSAYSDTQELTEEEQLENEERRLEIEKNKQLLAAQFMKKLFSLNVQMRVTRVHVGQLVTCVRARCAEQGEKDGPLVDMITSPTQMGVGKGQLELTAKPLTSRQLVALARAIGDCPVVRRVILPSDSTTAPVVRAFIHTIQEQVRRFVNVASKGKSGGMMNQVLHVRGHRGQGSGGAGGTRSAGGRTGAGSNDNFMLPGGSAHTQAVRATLGVEGSARTMTAAYAEKERAAANEEETKQEPVPVHVTISGDSGGDGGGDGGSESGNKDLKETKKNQKKKPPLHRGASSSSSSFLSRPQGSNTEQDPIFLLDEVNVIPINHARRGMAGRVTTFLIGGGGGRGQAGSGRPSQKRNSSLSNLSRGPRRGTVNFVETQNVISAAMRQKLDELCGMLYQANTRLEASRIFGELDEDGSGLIDREELKSGMLRFGVKLTEKDIDIIMAVCDKDGNNSLDQDEFCDIVVRQARRQWTSDSVKGEISRLIPSHRWLIHPNSAFSKYWDLLTLFLLAYVGLVTPFEVGFYGLHELMEGKRDPNTKDISEDVLFAINRVVDAFFLVDIGVQFHLQFPRPSGRGWVSDRTAIRLHYLRTWFLVDFVSIFPFWLLALGDLVSNTTRTMTKLFRLVKLSRFFRVGRMLKRWEARVTWKYSHMALLKWGIIIILICHWLACLWMITVHIWPNQRETWYYAGGYYGESYSGAALYAVCFYWSLQTISTIGYGDVANPNNVLERFMAVVAMTIGSVTWAYIVGTMCALISALDRETAEFHHVMDKLNDFVVDRRLGPTLRDRLRTYFRERWTLSKANGYKELIDMMSPSLKGHVAAAATLEWLRKVSWMRKARLPFLHSVALSLEAQVYPPEELIPGDHFTLIMRGVAVKDVRVYISGN